MKFTKAIEKEIRQVMITYWEAYMTGDLETWASFLPDDYRNIGTTNEEIWNSRNEILNYTEGILDQLVGQAQLRNNKTEIIVYDPYFMVHEFGDIDIKAGNKWNFYSRFRLSSLLQKINNHWYILHQHGSYPDPKTEEGEAFAFEKISKENLELKDAVKRRTVELEQKNRELEIDSALEKVRSSALAMNQPEDMVGVCRIISDQLQLLGVNDIRNVQTVIINEQKGSYLNYQYFAAYEKGVIEDTDYNKHPTVLEMVQQLRKSKDAFFTGFFEGEELKTFRDWRKQYNQFPDPLLDEAISVHYYFYSIGEGGLGLSTYKPISDAGLDIFKRFHSVFTLAYRRFVDIELAEAQAREAQIELSLERIRSQATAMKESSDLLDIVVTMNAEFNALGHEAHYFWHMRWLPDTYEKSMTSGDGSRIGMVMELPRGFHENATMIEWEQNREPVAVFTFDTECAIDYVDKMIRLGRFSEIDHNAPGPDDIRAIGGLTFVMARTTHGEIGYSLPGVVSDPPEEDLNTLVRFAGVFDLAYRRFEDLKSAELQNRETQIELALERVRSKTMAMHNSADVGATVVTLFDEVLKLGLDKSIRVGIGILEGNEGMETWSATSTPDGEVDLKMGMLDMTIHPMLIGLKKAWKSGKTGYSYDYIGDDVFRYYEALNNEPEYPFQADLDSLPENEYHKSFFYAEGILFSFAPNPISDEAARVLNRFAGVFGQTYRRYLDLQKAELQAKEAIKQASLDRVRGQIASMRSTDDLQRITPLIWRELKTLSVPFIRCGVFIIDEIFSKVQVYLTTPEGKPLGVLNLPVESTELTKEAVDHWRKKDVYTIHWNKDDFIDWMRSMIRLGQIQNKKEYQGDVAPPETLDLHFIPFGQGMLYVGNNEPLPEDKIDLVKSLAEAFSVAYARYEDFKQLEDAKNQIETTLNDLKATQTQLIHAEKMASLGELTAGIAHEIQNPLNFVNNFSEVNSELITELIEEIETGDKEEALAIANDLFGNEEKIIHHGKRADDIVKGMLQHSRTTTGEKEPTDINLLADEYLRLAYHGLRAKDKSFNADFKVELDESLPKINVIPQDIGRVLLNLITNAFYACTERSRSAVNEKVQHQAAEYQPTVSVSTKKEGDKVYIEVKDNGNGIPQHVLDKIFQPFFTTKPTGQGTGLGLSLSYDIVKAHGGQLTVETKESEGTVFFIQLPV